MAPPAGPPPAPSGPRALSPATRAWFTAAFDTPTPAQEKAWEAIAGGDHALVVAPTGSGKTLAAFLWAIDRLLHSPQPPPQTRCRVVYVSPLKALAADVQRNLTAPLAGIRAQDPQLRELRVAMRTGDTPPAERRRMARRPPDVLVTTPESLYLLLTSGARESLRGVETVIVDEVHAVAGTKRGAHLAVTLERLDELVAAPVQRIGLSATVRPAGAVARFLTGVRPPSDGGRPVQIIQPAAHKTLRLDVEVPVPDLSDPPDAPHHAQEGASPSTHRASVWPHVEERVVDLVATHRSTIVFTNSRRTAERLTARVNEVWSRRRGEQVAARQPAAQLAGQSGTASTGGDDVLARTHHGSMSPEERREVEEALKAGTLRAVVATATLELGIDMGFVELVVHVGTPPSVAATVQRTGRGGHQVGAPSHGVVLPLHRADLVVAALTARRAVAGEVEEIHPVRNPLDVLAQHVVATLVANDWRVADLAAMVRRAAPFAELGEHSLRAVLDMLAGRYPSEDFANLRPRIVWDRHADVLQARPGALRLATTSGGTIPDRGLYGVFLAAGEGATATQPGRGGRRVGELDEEMVHESRVGDAIVLGSSTWRIEEITPDRVLVSPVAGVPGRQVGS